MPSEVMSMIIGIIIVVIAGFGFKSTLFDDRAAGMVIWLIIALWGAVLLMIGAYTYLVPTISS